jgi:multidrug efflux pump subunit AcrB
MSQLVNNKSAFSPFSVIVVFLALMVIGVAFVPLLDVRFKPERNLPQLSVRFSWPNASPQVIEQETSKIEGILGKINQVKSIESTSSVGTGVVTLNFDKTANLDQKRYEVSMLIRQLRSNLPTQMSYPEITSRVAQNDNQASFMVLTLNATTTTYQIGKIAEQQVIPELLKIKGIGDINLHGVTPHQWEITFNPQLLESYSVLPAEISAVVNRLGATEFLGNQQEGFGASVPVLATEKYIPPGNWESLPVSKKTGGLSPWEMWHRSGLKKSHPHPITGLTGKIPSTWFFILPGGKPVKTVGKNPRTVAANWPETSARRIRFRLPATAPFS